MHTPRSPKSWELKKTKDRYHLHFEMFSQERTAHLLRFSSPSSLNIPNTSPWFTSPISLSFLPFLPSSPPCFFSSFLPSFSSSFPIHFLPHPRLCNRLPASPAISQPRHLLRSRLKPTPSTAQPRHALIPVPSPYLHEPPGYITTSSCPYLSALPLRSLSRHARGSRVLIVRLACSL